MEHHTGQGKREKCPLTVSGLGENTTSDTSEHSNSRASKTVASKALEKELVVDAALITLVGGEVLAVDEGEGVENHHADSHERIAHNTTSAESTVEAALPTVSALLLGRDSGPGVGVHSNHHSDVSGEDGSESAHDKRKSGEAADIPGPDGLAVLGGVRRKDKDKSTESW